MELIDIIRAMLAPTEFKAWLQEYKKRRTVDMRIRKKLFPGTAVNWPDVRVSLAMLKGSIKNAPVVRRGTKSYALSFEEADTMYIEPQGINLSQFIKAADLNNMRKVGEVAIKQLLDFYQLQLSTTTDSTLEAISCQALTGKINYPMMTEGGALIPYVVDYGATQMHTPAKKIDAADATIVDVFNTLQAMDKMLKKKGFGSKRETLAGTKVFMQILKLAQDTKTNIFKVEVKEGMINVGGYKVELENGEYHIGDDAAGDAMMNPYVEEDAMVMFDPSSNKLFYTALDDLDANLQALPIFMKPVKEEDPNGIKLLSNSKPLPAVNVDSICWARDLFTAAK